MASFDVPPELRRGAAEIEDVSIDTAVWLIDHMCAQVGLADLSGTAVLDIGCGVKFTQAFLTRGVPVHRYVGLDVHRKMIEHLQANVDDPRLSYAWIDARNERYNPRGVALAEVPDPAVAGPFDLVCLFSVFTHLAPHDYQDLLRFARRFAAPDARLFYTLFLDEPTDTGLSFRDKWTRPAPGSTVVPAAAQRPVLPFRDVDPSRPLLWALYSREHALELVADTGWEVLDVVAPNPYAAHQVVCRAV
ncbi:MAG: hypothetical protein JWM05_1494 [Acidimicrobiales bacterium]|nr:hypothetical protein [Acidimicrobiales bacterium]